LRSAFARSGFEFETLVVHYGLGMKSQPVERLAEEYLFDLPGDLSAFNISKETDLPKRESWSLPVSLHGAQPQGLSGDVCRASLHGEPRHRVDMSRAPAADAGGIVRAPFAGKERG
jgi:hypothetical protein